MINSYQLWYEQQQEKKARKLLPDLKEYLLSKLQLVEVVGQYKFYSCRHDHDFPGRDWQPFGNLKRFCKKRDLDWQDLKELIEDIMGKKLVCECELVNDFKELRRTRLQKAFGLDFGEPGRETCGLSEDEEKR